MAELKYWVWLSRRKGIGAGTMNELIRHFGSPENIYFADEKEYLRVLQKPAVSLCDKSLDEARGIIDECADKNIRIMALSDAQYPMRLRNIFDPPVVLYVSGKLPNIDDEIAIAMVGTRSFTPYGVVTAERMGYEIAKEGGLIVTGLAAGIDSAAAKGALRAGGKVIGVLGCGTDVIYPKNNKALFEDVKAVGALISEYPPRTSPDGRHFPVRNRIISGISLGVLVIEAPEKSGALITASKALEQGRDVFAVPGNVDSPACKGSNGLLKDGALVAVNGHDVIEEYRYIYPHKFTKAEELCELDDEEKAKLIEKEREKSKEKPKEKKKVFDKEKIEDYIDNVVQPDELTAEELQIVKVISEKSMHIDDIIAKCGLPAAEVLSALTMLELSGAVTQEAGKRFTSHVNIK